MIALSERALPLLLQISAFNDAGLRARDAATGDVLGVAPPGPNRSAVAADGTVILWAGPRRILLAGQAETTDGAALIDRLTTALEGVAGVVDLSGGRIAFSLEGPAARTVLAKGSGVDWRPHAFPPGAVALTGIAGMAVLVHGRGEVEFDILVSRSYGRSLRHWLDVACREFTPHRQAP